MTLLEALLVSGLLAAALLPLATAWLRSRARGALALVALFAAAFALARLYLDSVVVDAGPADRPIEEQTGGYVSSGTCKTCHPAEYESWFGSYHRRMTQIVSPATVAAPFSEAEFEVEGHRYRFFRRGDEVWCETQDPSTGARTPHRVVMSTGSHHLQVYWLPTGNLSRVRPFPLVYSLEREAWAPLESVFIVPPAKEGEVRNVRWNTTCSQCHATHAKPGVVDGDAIDTTVAEMGIACEACHGPGGEHVRANQDPLRRLRLHAGDDADPTIVQPERLSPARSVEVCGQCHGLFSAFKSEEGRSKWLAEGHEYRPGQELTAHRAVIPFSETVQWSDGQVRVSGRELNALLASPCYAHGDESRGIMTCLSCHVLHPDGDDPRPLVEWANDQLKPHMDSNRAGRHTNATCTGCHAGFEADAELVAHTHHAAESSGSQCLNCHMPHTTWGLVKAMRSHEITSPSARETVAVGRPNACNLCHMDKSLGWVARQLQERFGQEPPQLTEEQETIADSVLHALRGDAGARALSAWSMGWEPAQQASGTAWMAPFLATLLEDPYDVVRAVAARSLGRLEGFTDFEVDPNATPRQLAEARRRALALWEQRIPPGRNPAVLQGEDGRLDRERHDRLLGERDNRHVVLAE